MDETPSVSTEKSPQIKLTLPASDVIRNVRSSSPSPSPSERKQNQFFPQNKLENTKSQCDISMSSGSATGN